MPTDSADGVAGVAGADGAPGIQGDPGNDGSDGSDGIDGVDGQDADQGTTWWLPGGTDGQGITAQWQSDVLQGEVNASFEVTGATGPGGEFLAGDTITVTVSVKDADGIDIDPADMNLLDLRMNGPRNSVTATHVPTKLFGGTVNANGSVTAANRNLLSLAAYDGAAKTWTYTTAALSDEAAGTYTIAVRAQGPVDDDGVRRAQDFELQDVQIKTAAVDDLTIERFKCAACHLGANNGKFYLHHIDNNGTPNGGSGDWARDSNPVRNCKNCHNNSAVAGYNVCAVDGTEGDLMLRDTDISARNRVGGCPEGYTQTRRADNIVNRVHGVHMGQDRRGQQVNADGSGTGWKPRNTAAKRGLQNPRNIAYPGSKLFDSSETDANSNAHAVGDFRNFAAVGFPSDARNCEKCHADEAYLQKPSRLACGTCHDNVNFSYGGVRDAFEPRYFKCDDGSINIAPLAPGDVGYTPFGGRKKCVSGATYAGEIAHPGGQKFDDSDCMVCHGPGQIADIAEMHNKPEPTSGAPRRSGKEGKFTVETEWTNLPVDGYYSAGDAPVLRVVIKENGTAVDHMAVTQSNSWTVNGWLNGPRAKKIPVLSSAARADITSLQGPFNFGGSGGNLVIEIDGGANDAAGVGSSGGVTAVVALAGDMTAAEVAAALNANAVFASKAVAYTLDADTGVAADAAYLKIRGKPSYSYSGIKVRDGKVADELFDDGSDTNAFNDLEKQYDLFTANAHRSGSGAYSEFQLHQRSATNGARDPKLTLTADGLEYRFDAIDASILAGSYTLALVINDGTANTPQTYYTELVQIGTATEEQLIASNCKSCHDFDKRWHENAPRGDGYPFSTNYCGSCHDYKQQRGGTNPANGLPYSWLAVAGSTAGNNWGYGAQPHSKRLHGLHFGNYLFKPKDVHSGYQVDKVIYPVDVRNCQKCHATADSKFSMANQYNEMGTQRGLRDADAATADNLAATWANNPAGQSLKAGKAGNAAAVEAHTADFEITSGSNVSKPSRIACNGCHDSEAAISHTALMTYDPTPANPFSGDESESCTACHGPGRDYAISTKVMDITTPFQFPYPRRPSWIQ